MGQLKVNPGYPRPYGVTQVENGHNFAIFSKHAKKMSLLFKQNDQLDEIPLDPIANRTGHVWHILIDTTAQPFFYAFRIDGQNLLDPYAKEVYTGRSWSSSDTSYSPFGVSGPSVPFDWEGDTHPSIPLKDLVIYEMHVRGFTKHASSQTKHPGTFLGVIEKIPHLLDLGINAVELLPIQEFDESEYKKIHPKAEGNLCQYWGYSTMNFFAPMARYASSNEPFAAINEFKTMVKELHRHGIEVILDVVFNHTAEGGKDGPVLSFKGLEQETYYILDEKKKYRDFTGCGNTFNCNQPVAMELIIETLRYWILEMHVDGFRFDLASTFYRDTHGDLIRSSPIVEVISKDPLLANCKLIAEPWDASGLYQVGAFYPAEERCSEWNDKYRDQIRRFIKGVSEEKGNFATRLSGSQDLYPNLSPWSSINFITAHDGFTLADLVSYNTKHNLPNGENNRDGNNNNESWNCGVEGETKDPKILALRQRQMRNFHLALMVSQGVPMILMGDEYGHTKKGNNNTWCQDNELNWFLWDRLTNNNFYFYYKFLIHFRRSNPLLRYGSFLTTEDIEWHGLTPFHPNWDKRDPFIAFTLIDQTQSHDLYIAFNTGEQEVNVEIPLPPKGKIWRWVVNTGNASPNDFYDESNIKVLSNLKYKMSSYSALMLKAEG